MPNVRFKIPTPSSITDEDKGCALDKIPSALELRCPKSGWSGPRTVEACLLHAGAVRGSAPQTRNCTHSGLLKLTNGPKQNYCSLYIIGNVVSSLCFNRGVISEEEFLAQIADAAGSG
jgi:hypothetical protein